MNDKKSLVLEPKEIAEILKCSLPVAYRLMDQKDFPSIRLGESKKSLRRVSKEAFFRWLAEKEKKEV